MGSAKDAVKGTESVQYPTKPLARSVIRVEATSLMERKMSISRSWTLSDVSVEPSDQDRTYLDALMEEWSAIQTEIENEQFRRQADREDGYNDGPDCDNEDCSRRHPCEDCKAMLSHESLRNQRRQVKLDVIESLLESHGARVMRPYEHWNEDERYMEYQESRYDY